MASIFFSYSHDDEQYRDQLEKHLSLLQHQGLIETWHDRRITAGSEIDDSIDEKLESSDIVLLLVSSSFLASRYCYSREMTRAMQRHEDGSARVIPVIVRPCDWHSAPFGKLLAAPKNGKAITTWANYDEAYTDVARQIRVAVEQSGAKAKPVTAPAPIPHDIRTPKPGQPRSSNLRLKKEFTQLEADTFLRESFEFIARFFEGSLEELQARNPGIEGRFHRVDGNTFTAAIYRAGKRESECSIHLGSGGFRSSSIAFSYDPSARGNSYNESLSVEHDDQSMYLKPLGMNMRHREDNLSQEGAGEMLWAMLIERLQ